MFIICLHNEFYVPNPSGPLDIAVKPEAKRRFHSSTTLPIYVFLKKQKMSTKANYFSKVQLITTYMSVRESATSTYDIRMAAMLELLMVRY
jgi:hypothetical protein